MAKIRATLRPFPAREVIQACAPDVPALVRVADAQRCQAEHLVCSDLETYSTVRGRPENDCVIVFNCGY